MFLESLENVGLLLLMAVPAFIVVKLKLVNRDNAVKVISVILLYICQPFVTFNAFLNTEYNLSIFLNAVCCFAVTVILIAILSFAGKLIFKYEKNKDDLGVLSFAGAYGNIGYLCVPFLMLMYPNNSEIILYASAAIVGFNISSWTIGNYLLTSDKSHISVKKAIFNPATLSLIAVMPLYLLNINFIRFTSLGGLKNIISLFSNLVAPLAMSSLGFKFADIKIKELFLDIKIYPSILVKLVLSPALAFLMLLIISLFMDIEAIQLNIITLSAMPVANNLLMFTSLHNKNSALATNLILLSTLLSIITIPITLHLLV